MTRYRLQTRPDQARDGWRLVLAEGRLRADFRASCGGRVTVEAAPVRIRALEAGTLRVAVRGDVRLRFETHDLVAVDDALQALADLRAALAAGRLDVACDTVEHGARRRQRPRRD